MQYQYVTTNDTLAIACKQIVADQIALDTEFVRIRTYYQQLGLIQLYDGQQLLLIDPLTITDWQPFITLLTDESITKLLFSYGEDIEVFYHNFSHTIPTPVIDIQIADAFLQRGRMGSFASLAKEYLNVELGKTESRTDWLIRPLTKEQCHYAASDVYYLLPMASKIRALIKEQGFEDILKQECERLVKKRCDILQPDQAYKTINNAWRLTAKSLAYLQRLAAWRLIYAREHNIAVNFVVKEDHLWQLAMHHPDSFADLNQLGLSGSEIRLHGNTLLEILKQGIGETDFPEKLQWVIDYPNYKKQYDFIKKIVNRVAKDNNIASTLLASRKQINHYIQWLHDHSTVLPEIITGWRGQLLQHVLDNTCNTTLLSL